MHTTEEWHGHAHFNMANAFHTQKKADKQLDMSMKSHHNARTANLNKFEALHATMEQKVSMTRRIKEKLHQRADSLQQSNQLTRQSLAQLDEALQSKEEPLKLCMWRIEERKRRPQRELVHDNVTDLLEDEKNTLLDTRRRLTESIQKTKSTVVVLDDKLGEVSHDWLSRTRLSSWMTLVFDRPTRLTTIQLAGTLVIRHEVGLHSCQLLER